MDKGQDPGGVRHLPDDIKQSPQYLASTTWGKHDSPGSHASMQQDHPYTRERESSGSPLD